MNDTTPKTRTVTLSHRAPVKIREDEWPIIAQASGDSWEGHPGDSQYHQALNDGSLDTYKLIVRQHADGRTLVYGVVSTATFFTRSPNWRGGRLLTPETGIAYWIRNVGAEGRIPEHIIRECIADLPAEEL